jgi:hypothetical protein
MGTIGGQAPLAEETVTHFQLNPVMDPTFILHL